MGNGQDRHFTVGGVSVVARIPEDWDRRVGVVLAHGAGQGMDSPFMTAFSDGLASRGYLTVRFNFPYMEAGRRAPDSRTKLRETYAAIMDAVVSEFDPTLLVIGGKSMGGRMASYVAAEAAGKAGKEERVGALLFLGYPLHPAGQPDRMRDEHLYGLSLPMLFVSGTRDTLAQRDLLAAVLVKLPDSATIHWVERGDHSFRSGPRTEENREAALGAIDEWLRRISSGESRSASAPR